MSGITADVPDLTIDTSAAESALEATTTAADTVKEKMGEFPTPDTSGATAALESVQSTIDSASGSVSDLESSVSSMQTAFLLNRFFCLWFPCFMIRYSFCSDFMPNNFLYP